MNLKFENVKSFRFKLLDNQIKASLVKIVYLHIDNFTVFTCYSWVNPTYAYTTSFTMGVQFSIARFTLLF